MRLLFLILLVTAGLAGCAVGPKYHRPLTETKPHFGETNNLVNSNTVVAQWWKEFHDPLLNRLIETALQSNLDLQIATLRIRESRFQRNIAAADLFPTVDADGSYTHSRGSKNVVLPLGGSSGASGGGTGGSGGASGTRAKNQSSEAGAPGGTVGANPLSQTPSPFGQGGLPGATTDLYQMGFDASWEIDVFGSKRKQVEAAAAEVAAAHEAHRALQVSLAAEVGRDYLELRGSQDRLRIARENLQAQQEVLELTHSKRKAGLTDDFDVIRATSAAAETAATLSPLEADERRMVHALSILVGRQPMDLETELATVHPLPAIPPEVPIGLPSQLVERRADIRQAEREIAAANARIGSATAELFPKFALIANAGLDASQPGNLLSWDSRYFLISPTVVWRIFDAGRILSNIRLQKANERESSIHFQAVLLQALREVEDALVSYATERARQEQLAVEVQQDQIAVQLARQQYEKGLSDFINVLEAQRTLLVAQDSLAQSQLSVATDLVALYKSLGGGWK